MTCSAKEASGNDLSSLLRLHPTPVHLQEHYPGNKRNALVAVQKSVELA